MIDVFCIPVLLYGLEALDMNAASIKTIDIVYNGVFVKLFNITDTTCIRHCQHATMCLPTSYRLDLRTLNFFMALKAANPVLLHLFFFVWGALRG